MRKRYLLGFILIAGACVVLAQEKAPASEDEGKILALENLWNRAEQSKDVTALSHIFAPTMIYVDYDGSLKTRDQFLNYLKNDSSSPDQLASEELTVRSYGNFAVVTGIFRGRWNKGGKTIQLRGRYVDTWAKINGSWQCVSAQATLIQSH
jgi:ketosteroid isomerase-like protein